MSSNNNSNSNNNNVELKKYPADYVSGVSVDKDEINLSGYVDVIQRRWLAVVIVIVIFAALGLYNVQKKPLVYMSVCDVIVKSSSGITRYNMNDFSAISNLSSLVGTKSLDTNIEMVKSPDVIKDAYSRLSSEEKKSGFHNRIPYDKVSAGNRNETEIISITVKAFNPDVAAKMANLIATVFFEKDIKNQRFYTKEALVNIKGEIDNVTRELKNVRDDISKFKARTGIYIPENGGDLISAVGQKNTTESDLEKVVVELESSKVRLAALDENINKYSDTIAEKTSSVNPTINQIVIRIDTLTTEKKKLLQTYQPDSPEVKKIDEQIEFEREKLAESKNEYFVASAESERTNDIKESLKSERTKLLINIYALNKQKSEMEKLLEKKEAFLKLMPAEQDKYTELSDVYLTLQNTLTQLTQQYYTLMINGETNLKPGIIQAEAVSMPNPVEPNFLREVMYYVLFGILFGIAVAFILENIDTAIHEEVSVMRFTNSPCLGRIPLVNTTEDERVQIGLSHNNKILEPFRIFRNNLLFLDSDNEKKIFAITGPDAKQGKSTISINLAIVMALDGKKVLLVDADLRKPNIAKWFGIKNNKGYSNLVKGLCTLEEAVKKSDIANLDLLPTGPLPPNPTEFLNSRANRETVKKLKENYDVIIYDTSPCSFIADTQIVSTYVDGVVMVVTIKQTKKNSLKHAIDHMRSVNAPLLGYVLNKIPISNRGYYSKYYYYSSYYEDEESK